MVAAFTQREFRDALSRFATGVTIVTTRDASHAPVGMTAGSFNSVSLDPPLVLWSVTKAAQSAPAFHAARHFAVHVLAADQTDLSNRFARRGEDKFAGLDTADNAHGVPLLPDFAARFECTTWAVHEGGDHWIIIGEVDALQIGAGDGLIFSGGAYASAAPIRAQSGGPEGEPDGGGGPVESMLLYLLARAWRNLSDEFHAAVQQSGLSVPEWRVLASLQGQVTRSLPDLSARTFINPEGLMELLQRMAAQDLCALCPDPDGTMRATGSAAGEARVAKLFALEEEQKNRALAGLPPEQSAQLIPLLQHIIARTKP